MIVLIKNSALKEKSLSFLKLSAEILFSLYWLILFIQVLYLVFVETIEINKFVLLSWIKTALLILITTLELISAITKSYINRKRKKAYGADLDSH